MWVGSLISAVLGNVLPGPGTLYRSQTFEFVRRVHVGDKLRVTVTCREKRGAGRRVRNRDPDAAGQPVCRDGDRRRATHNVETPARELPALIMDEKDHFAHLIALAAQLPRAEDRHRLPGGP